MGIDVARVNEQHKREQVVFDPKQHVLWLATHEWPNLQQTFCLRFIGPYGDTVFNQSQIPVLLAELTWSAEAQSNAEVKAHLATVCQLVASAQDQLHTYIKFIGD